MTRPKFYVLLFPVRGVNLISWQADCLVIMSIYFDQARCVLCVCVKISIDMHYMI